MKNKKILSPILAIAIFSFVLILDLLTKEFVISKLIPNVGDATNVFPGFINFIYVKNTGAAWGMLAGRPVFLIVVSIMVLSLLIIFYILRLKKTGKNSSSLFGISLGLIAGGCIGNLIDRIAFGYVRDFINFQFIDFPVFNFADVALTFGMILIVVYFIFYYSKEERNIKIEKSQEKEQKNVSFSNKNENLNPLSEDEPQSLEEKEGEDNEG